MPHLKELAAKHAEKGLVVVGVHTTASADGMAAFVKEQGIGYAVAADVGGQTVKAFAVDSFPDYYLVDRQGRLRFADLVNDEVDRAVETLLAEPPPAAEKADAEQLYAAALAEAKQSGRRLLVHVHGPG